METAELHFRCNEGGMADYAAQLREVGTVMLPAYVAFDAHELARIDALQARLPEEPVTAGDAGDTHDIYVRRIMVDRAGERPQLVNLPHSETILNLATLLTPPTIKDQWPVALTLCTNLCTKTTKSSQLSTGKHGLPKSANVTRGAAQK